MFFSGDRIPTKYISYISSIVEDEGFSINEGKTALISPNRRKIITGISISRNELKIPKPFKRKIRKEFHFVRKYGYYSHISKLKINNPFYLESLLGKIIFWLSVEPQNEYAKNSCKYLRKLIKAFNN